MADWVAAESDIRDMFKYGQDGKNPMEFKVDCIERSSEDTGASFKVKYRSFSTIVKVGPAGIALSENHRLLRGNKWSELQVRFVELEEGSLGTPVKAGAEENDYSRPRGERERIMLQSSTSENMAQTKYTSADVTDYHYSASIKNSLSVIGVDDYAFTFERSEKSDNPGSRPSYQSTILCK